MKGCEILCVDPESPDEDTIDKAAALIKMGGLVVFPTSSFYGLGASAFHSETVEKVFRAKKRDPQNPVLILIASLAELVWPGSLTLVFQAADVLPSNLTGNTGKIGIRLASHAVAHNLVSAVGKPITGTSANISGQGGCITVAGLDQHIRDQVDLVIDAGKLPGGEGSTVVDVTVNPPKIIREGAIRAAKIHAVLEGA
jgi:L-threonylcarbamoyladenylate synthase